MGGPQNEFNGCSLNPYYCFSFPCRAGGKDMGYGFKKARYKCSVNHRDASWYAGEISVDSVQNAEPNYTGRLLLMRGENFIALPDTLYFAAVILARVAVPLMRHMLIALP